MTNKFFVTFFCLITLGTALLSGSEHTTIWGGAKKNIDQGCIYSNRYCQAAFMNASRFSYKAKVGDFAVIPHKDVDNNNTYDESLAKVRLFFKPDVSVRTIGRRTQLVNGQDDWVISKTQNGVVYTRNYKRDSNEIKAIIEVKLLKEQAAMQVDCKLTNTGSRPCKTESAFEFSFIKNDVTPLMLTLERQRARYDKNNKRVNYSSNEITRMDGRTQAYWWRRVAKEIKFSNYFNRERIPFGHPRLVSPKIFGATGLIGENALFWDLQNTEDLSMLDVSWEAECGYITPIWQRDIEPGKEVKISYRVLTLKKMPRIDVIAEGWAFAYIYQGEKFQIVTLPLFSFDAKSNTAGSNSNATTANKKTVQASSLQSGCLSITTMVNNENGQVLINQRNEVPTTTPFTPAKVDMRSSGTFELGRSYKINLSLNSLEDNSKILSINGDIIP